MTAKCSPPPLLVLVAVACLATARGAAVVAAAEVPVIGRIGADPELNQISLRFTHTLAIHSNISGNEGDAKVALSHLDRSTGQFNDLNYSFTPYAHIGQPQSDHLTRCNLLASLWMSPLSSYYQSSNVKSAGLACTQWYVNNNPPSTNWFMTQLWIPINIGQLLFIYGDQMPQMLATKAIQIMKQVDEKGPKDKSQGANAANVGRVHIMLGLLAGNRTAVASGFAAFYHNVKVNPYCCPPLHSGEGIRPDFSFMQHGPLLYNGVYGVSFAENLLRVAYQTAGTSFAMTDDAYTIMSSFILDGTQHMIMYPSLNWDISVIGRGYSYPEGQRSSIADLAWMIAEVGGNRSSEWIDFAGRLNHTVGDLSDSSHFWDYAQYTVHHRKDIYTVTQRMINTATLSSETINGEGLVGFHLGDGATYVYLTGEEYYDIFPCWDFQLIPGTTVEYGTTCSVDHHVGHYGTTSTVGGASNGLATVAAWKFQAPSIPADPKKHDTPELCVIIIIMRGDWPCPESWLWPGLKL